MAAVKRRLSAKKTNCSVSAVNCYNISSRLASHNGLGNGVTFNTIRGLRDVRNHLDRPIQMIRAVRSDGGIFQHDVANETLSSRCDLT